MEDEPQEPHQYPTQPDEVVAQARQLHGIGIQGLVDQLRAECDLHLAAHPDPMHAAAAKLKQLQDAMAPATGDGDVVPPASSLETVSRDVRRRWALLESFCHVVISLRPGHVVDMVRALDEASRLVGKARRWLDGPSADFLAWAREVDGKHVPMVMAGRRRALPESLLRARSALRQARLEVEGLAADIADGVLATPQGRQALPKASKPLLVYLQWTLRDGRHHDADDGWGDAIFTWPEVARLVDDLEEAKQTAPQARARDRVRKFREAELAAERSAGGPTADDHS